MILFIVRSFYKIDGHQSDPNDNLDAPESHKFKSPAKKIWNKMPLFYPVGILGNEFLPGSGRFYSCQWRNQLIMMTHCDSQRVSRVEMFFLNVDSESSLKYIVYLLLGCCTIACNCLLGLSRSIFGNGDVPGGCSQHCSALRSAEFQYHLRVLSVERRLQGHFIRRVPVADFTYFIENAHELPVRVFFFSQVNDPHLHVLGLAAFCTNDPEAKNVGSGVYSQYRLHLS